MQDPHENSKERQSIIFPFSPVPVMLAGAILSPLTGNSARADDGVQLPNGSVAPNVEAPAAEAPVVEDVPAVEAPATPAPVVEEAPDVKKSRCRAPNSGRCT